MGAEEIIAEVVEPYAVLNAGLRFVSLIGLWRGLVGEFQGDQ